MENDFEREKKVGERSHASFRNVNKNLLNDVDVDCGWTGKQSDRTGVFAERAALFLVFISKCRAHAKNWNSSRKFMLIAAICSHTAPNARNDVARRHFRNELFSFNLKIPIAKRRATTTTENIPHEWRGGV